MPSVISVEHLSKAYRLGQIGTGTFANDLKVWWAKVRGKPNPLLKIGQEDHGNRDGEIIWALKDVSFTVEQGEVLGVIGRNGAGKSTLLKILSRITAPTEGVVRVKGRIASLLEVGTGFHPELTGRENIYLNGAILGMSRKEIDRKFDEIVAFAEIEPFIDTPVKRYSSGMYVRLAFAVAAHLDAEILLVDEVLAVGDAAFQKKCLGKMGDVASQEGRTVLFVSHNMAAVQQLTLKSILLYQGRLVDKSVSSDMIRKYLSSMSLQNSSENRLTVGSITIKEIYLIQDDVRTNSIDLNSSFKFCINYHVAFPTKNILLGFDLISDTGITLFRAYDLDVFPLNEYRYGEYESVFVMPPKILQKGTYHINLIVAVHRETRLNPGKLSLSFNVDSLRQSDVDYIGIIASPGNWEVTHKLCAE
ncbi:MULTISPECIES: ABC transporter ATP-binding protein [Anaerolinea]|uniref:Polysaccharide ABC transporter ATP-binding protein n=1 Tax=Anaerolinea thermophila (strain DSM 14523 / JCM 11388 / NBRC 100420 / UNI-1) TaxID=926569 RepID=E8N098_ANATU|nr:MULTISPECIES: ABC transporter ATP-binding protein [Anaerolinea]BAJ64647.1 putative polysaccharide ABC transporter ATP-binding protein [Anaerolinea thermophila UNI-1]